ncbi:MAG: helix-turn-helix domain-containing protein [Burkholderiaceae bacterium]
MVDTPSIPQLLRETRLQRGLDIDSLAYRACVSKNHLIDLEAGIGRSFHSVEYCRKAIMMVAHELDIEDQVAALWREADWGGAVAKTRPIGLEASSSGLLPVSELSKEAKQRWWLLTAVVASGLIAWLALGRLDVQPPEPTGTAPSPATGLAGAEPQGSAATLASAPPPASSFRDDVDRAMSEWARLWRERNAAAYAGFYSSEFPGIAQHLGVRRQRMGEASFIRVTLSELSLRETGPGEITARFRQAYAADKYESNDLKEIVWKQTPSGPKIIAERLVN